MFDETVLSVASVFSYLMPRQFKAKTLATYQTLPSPYWQLLLDRFNRIYQLRNSLDQLHGVGITFHAIFRITLKPMLPVCGMLSFDRAEASVDWGA